MSRPVMNNYMMGESRWMTMSCDTSETSTDSRSLCTSSINRSSLSPQICTNNLEEWCSRSNQLFDYWQLINYILCVKEENHKCGRKVGPNYSHNHSSPCVCKRLFLNDPHTFFPFPFYPLGIGHSFSCYPGCVVLHNSANQCRTLAAPLIKSPSSAHLAHDILDRNLNLDSWPQSLWSSGG